MSLSSKILSPIVKNELEAANKAKIKLRSVTTAVVTIPSPLIASKATTTVFTALLIPTILKEMALITDMANDVSLCSASNHKDNVTILRPFSDKAQNRQFNPGILSQGSFNKGLLRAAVTK